MEDDFKHTMSKFNTLTLEEEGKNFHSKKQTKRPRSQANFGRRYASYGKSHGS